MAVNLNLLPQDLRISKGLNNILKTIRSVNVILVVIFIISITVAGAFFVIGNLSLKSIQNEVVKLENQVKAQESSEQQFVLIKDRLAKISTVRAYTNASINIGNVNSVLAGSLSNVKINALSINPSKIDMSVTLLSNEELKSYLSILKESGKFKSIDLYSFDYSKNIGYLVKTALNSK